MNKNLNFNFKLNLNSLFSILCYKKNKQWTLSIKLIKTIDSDISYNNYKIMIPGLEPKVYSAYTFILKLTALDPAPVIPEFVIPVT